MVWLFDMKKLPKNWAVCQSINNCYNKNYTFGCHCIRFRPWLQSCRPRNPGRAPSSPCAPAWAGSRSSGRRSGWSGRAAGSTASEAASHLHRTLTTSCATSLRYLMLSAEYYLGCLSHCIIYLVKMRIFLQNVTKKSKCQHVPCLPCEIISP